jgi:hypothetical protein
MSLPHKLYIMNFAGACLIVWCWWLGYIARVIEGDIAHMAEIMAGLFLLGAVSTFRLAFKVEAIRDRADMTAKGRLKSIQALIIKSEHLVVFASVLFILSIIGNAIGIKSMFHGIDPQSLASADGGQSLIAQVMNGAVHGNEAPRIGSLVTWGAIATGHSDSSTCCFRSATC